jgi:exopolyphosphatase/pppGpp-phosphohydrolase
VEDAIERRTAIRARVISGIEEARLIHLAAVYGVDTPKRAVVIDIGGGRVEITRGSGRKIALARSFKIIDPGLKNPDTEHWERAFRLFDLLI